MDDFERQVLTGAIAVAFERYGLAHQNLRDVVAQALPKGRRLRVRIGQAWVVGRVEALSDREPAAVWMTNEQTGKLRKFYVGPSGYQWEFAE